MNPDTPENRMYIQKTRLWLIGEVIVMRLLQERPVEPIPAIIAILENEKTRPTDFVDPPPPDLVAAGKEYLIANNIATLVEEWLRTALDTKPEQPIDFSIGYFNRIVAAAQGGGSIPLAASVSTTVPAAKAESPAAAPAAEALEDAI